MYFIKNKNYNFNNYFKENLLAFILLFLGTFHLFLQIKFGANNFGDLKDGRFSNFVLEHFYRALNGEEKSFKNANFFYPAPNVILLSDNHWFLGFIYVFFRNLGFNSSNSYNFWIFCGFFANFITSYYVLKKFNFSKNSSAIGAYLFTFNQIILQKIGHPQLNFKIFIPLTLLYSKQYFDFGKSVLGVLTAQRKSAERNGLAIDFNIPTDGSCMMYGDELKITRHVITNLIDNAIRYTRAGSIDVAVTCTPETVRMSVKDTGVGISPEDQPILFTEGGHGKNALETNVHATGYGLFIAKLVVDAHKGTIKALSEGPDKGSEFVVELPVGKVPDTHSSFTPVAA